MARMMMKVRNLRSQFLACLSSQPNSIISGSHTSPHTSLNRRKSFLFCQLVGKYSSYPNVWDLFWISMCNHYSVYTGTPYLVIGIFFHIFPSSAFPSPDPSRPRCMQVCLKCMTVTMRNGTHDKVCWPVTFGTCLLFIPSYFKWTYGDPSAGPSAKLPRPAFLLPREQVQTSSFRELPRSRFFFDFSRSASAVTRGASAKAFCTGCIYIYIYMTCKRQNHEILQNTLPRNFIIKKRENCFRELPRLQSGASF